MSCHLIVQVRDGLRGLANGLANSREPKGFNSLVILLFAPMLPRCLGVRTFGPRTEPPLS